MRKLKNEELSRLDIKGFKEASKISLSIVLDNVRSMHNVGTVFRTSDAFLIEKIYLCGITPTPPHKDIHKTALGATDSVAWEHVNNTVHLIQNLQNQNIITLAVEQAEGATYLNQLCIKKKSHYALVFGNEVHGVSQEVVDSCNGVVEIPQFGTKHSLNIAVSTGILIWKFWEEFQKK